MLMRVFSNPRRQHRAIASRRLVPGLIAAVLVLTAVAAPPLVAASKGKSLDSLAPQPGPSDASCAFCRAAETLEDFCPHCGRLSRIGELSSDHRSWIDVPYVVTFPMFDTTPTIVAEFSAQGVSRESVVFASGDRYDMQMEKKGPVVHGKVGVAGRGREMGYSATIEDKLDDKLRIATRQVVGRIQGDPDRYLYRTLDYKYSPDDRLDRIEFKTWYYRGSSDWKKRPSAWVGHSLGEIVLRRQDGVLTAIETKVREGGRSLRGETEYGEPRLMTEAVTRAKDRIDRILRVEH